MQGVVSAPGRVNLIGEHIDYHGLPVLPIALGRKVNVSFHRRSDRCIHAASASYGEREFEWTPQLAAATAGDWENYLRAAAQTVSGKWGTALGVDAEITSDLPPAAGLSSSSALLVAFTLALLRANGKNPGFEDLMEVLPEGEQFVGTRGGGMDHAACLASKKGCATLIEFEPLAVRHIPVPGGWAFLVAHSVQTAEKSGAAKEHYNARRRAGAAALKSLGFASYKEAVARLDGDPGRAPRLGSQMENDSFMHVVSEARRVGEAVKAMERADADRFGQLLLESHASLRDRLRVSAPALDRLVEAAMESGALGARLTGAGFGGCAVVFARKPDIPKLRLGLIEKFYAGCPSFDEKQHLIDAEPGPGVLHPA